METETLKVGDFVWTSDRGMGVILEVSDEVKIFWIGVEDHGARAGARKILKYAGHAATYWKKCFVTWYNKRL